MISLFCCRKITERVERRRKKTERNSFLKKRHFENQGDTLKVKVSLYFGALGGVSAVSVVWWLVFGCKMFINPFKTFLIWHENKRAKQDNQRKNKTANMCRFGCGMCWLCSGSVGQ